MLSNKQKVISHQISSGKCIMYLVPEADVISPVHITHSCRFQQTLIVKAVWDAEVMTVSETIREDLNTHSIDDGYVDLDLSLFPVII